MKLSTHKLFSASISTATLVMLIVVWFALTPQPISQNTFPSPAWVWEAIVSLNWNLVDHSLMTFARVVIGLEIGIFAGLLVGLLMSWNEEFYSFLNPLIEIARPVPVVALVPFFIIWFGTGAKGQIGLIALCSFMILVVNTIVAVNNLPSIYIRSASVLGASKARIYRTVILPAIIPQLQSGLRIAAALAFAVGIAAEFMGAQAGLGFMIMVARRTLNTNTILLGIVIIGIEAFIVDQAIKLIGRYVCRWTESSKESIRLIKPNFYRGARI